MSAKKYKVISPAKINWQLKVYPKSSAELDYHEVNTILQTLSLHDNIAITFDCDIDEPNFIYSGEFAEEIKNVPVHDNLIYKAIDGIYSLLDKTPAKYIAEIDKNIPLRAGLGGGSSNAAAAIIATCKHLSIDIASDLIQNFAANLGSDVPFFLKTGCAEMGGRGSLFIASHKPFIAPILLVKPNSGISTAKCYEQFDIMQTNSLDSTKLDNCKTFVNDNTKRPVLYNSLQLPATQINSEVKDVIEFLSNEVGHENVELCGSGACVFAICDDFRCATKLAGLAKLKGWWSRATYTSKVGASLLQ